ncbi:MAG: hypothetical protein Fur0042_26240 [Cyanophyceae cyanobacterium]
MERPAQPLSVSLIVPTYGREEPLCDTLQDAIAQDYPHLEILVVDQNAQHRPEVQAQLDHLAETGKIHLHRVPWASLPGARNYAARRATGDILIFIDDDVRMEPGFVAAHVRNYADRAIGAVAGRVFDRMKLTQSCTQDLEEFDYMPPEALDPAIAWYHLDLVRARQPQPTLTARGCNMSFRREIFHNNGIWFDERYRGSAVREESDFCLRIRKTGLKIWYDPEAHLVHLGEETGGCHDVSTRSMAYQVTFYHNHFWLGLKNLTPIQCLRFFAKLFDCHVLGHPPCYKSGSPIKIAVRGVFYFLALAKAIGTAIAAPWDDGQIYSRRDRPGHPIGEGRIA